MKTKVQAELLLASMNKTTGNILYTFRLTFPRCILSEINTHRVASRNTSSSRAIPIKKMRQAVLKDTFIPMSLGQNQRGMQAGAEITGWRRKGIEWNIRVAAHIAAFQSWLLEKLGAHKQISNRILEPYAWCTQIFSITDINNLLMLRNHPAAEPHFHELAKQMERWTKIAKSSFTSMEEQGRKKLKAFDHWYLQILEPGEWHLPLVLSDELEELPLKEAKQVSAARCARTSYTLVGTGKPSTLEEDKALCQKLFGSQPAHLSPTEHQAVATEESRHYGNFRGFRQFRKEVEHNPDFKPEDGVHLSRAEANFVYNTIRGYTFPRIGLDIVHKLWKATEQPKEVAWQQK